MGLVTGSSVWDLSTEGRRSGETREETVHDPVRELTAAGTKVSAVLVRKWLDLGYNLEGDPEGPAHRFDVGNGKKANNSG